MTRFLCFIALVLIASSASAQTTRREHDACSRDVVRLCRRVMNNGDQMVLTCLKQHRRRLSRGCNKVLIEHGQ
jgi:Cysteine rich repeat